ncbi:MAG: TonB-dependent receptor plug domain-containing protein [Steroidobacteraceae bacterium]
MKQLAWGVLVIAILDVPGTSSAGVPVVATQGVYQFDIKAGSLRVVLRQLAQQAGVQLAHFSNAVPPTLRAGPLRGGFTLEQALGQLLQGTGLTYRLANERTVVIVEVVERVQDRDRGSAPSTAANEDPSKPPARRRGLLARLAAFFAVCGSVTGVVCAEDATSAGLEEVMVTAERRETSLQDTPIAITALDARTLMDYGITDLEGVMKAAPSMSFAPYPSTANTLNVYMRGAGSQDPGQITVDSAIGLYQDGFYIARGQMVTFDLADVERVEVLRGPQGTLYGRNTTGGAVNLVSRKPSGELGFKQEIGFGSNGRFRSLSVFDLPEWHGLSSKFSFLRRQQDGYVKNIGSSHDFGEEEQTAGRVMLRWDTGAPFTVDYFHERGEINSTPYYYTNAALVGLIPGYTDRGHPETHSYRAIDLPESPGEIEGHGLTLSWNVNDALVLKSLTGYRDLSVAYNQDYAETFFAGFRSLDDIRTHQFSQELQAVGTFLDERINYVAGLYYFREAGSHYEYITITNALPGSAPLLMTKERNVDMESKSMAGYAQLTWTPAILEDRLDLTFGVRYTKDERAATRRLLNTYFGFPIAQEPAPGLVTENDLESSRFNPSFTANFGWTEDVSTYLRVATGYKAGGSSEGVDVGQFGLTFAPEDVTVYELGLKSDLFDRHLRLNAAAFISKYDDMQLFFATTPSDLSVVLGLNAGKATISGLELETLWQPTDSLSLTLAYTWLDPKYDEVLVPAGTIFDPAVNSASPYQVGEDVSQLFSFVQAPKNTLNLGSSWTFLKRGRSDLTAIVNYRWVDRTYNGAAAGPGVPNHKLASQPSNGLLDGRFSWQTELSGESRLRVDLWGKNLTDKAWPLFSVAAASSVAVHDPVTGVVTPAGYSSSPRPWAERRSYGVNLVYEF